MSPEELKALGDRIKAARIAKNMKQSDLAEALNVSPPYVSNIEQGKQVMSVAVLKEACDVLEVSADWLLRNKSKESLEYVQMEFAEMIKDCNSSEMQTLLQLLQSMKKAIRLKGADNVK